ncbi:hypothetical protein GQ55_4G226900 [Panicum hallii var. hallii]|uniref:Uncharacterized protein n=1 Tax=Panicum hallii var. hallii TaxID=1504633 RepID=A0A2T7DZF3_9POAL|nr:hypothetical protein GQ55_4G226900 [Panicum hallii var. hallii]PUZ60966.1 hypothetical protein GQ55_4G226900 [Panicum hallii var. hallii]
MAADPGGKPWPMMKPRPGLRTRGMPSPPIRLSILGRPKSSCRCDLVPASSPSSNPFPWVDCRSWRTDGPSIPIPVETRS